MKEVVLQIVSIITLKKLESIHIILYLWKKILAFHNVIKLIKSVVNKNKMNTTIIYFYKKGRIKINTLHNIFK